MTTQPENFIRGLRALALSDSAYARIREKLAAYADMHAVIGSGLYTSPLGVLSGWLADRRAPYAFAIAALLLVGSTATTMAAERAVPGQALYSVKIQVNEKVGAVWVNTSEERARYNARLAERRVDEAVILADAGKLDATAAAYLEEKVSLHLESSATAASALESEGDVATALSVRTDLEAHLAAKTSELQGDAAPTAAAAFSAGIAEDTSAEASPRAALADRLNEKVQVLAAARARSEAAVLPGLAEAKDRGLDLTLLRGNQDLAEAAIEGEAATAIMAADAPATTTEALSGGSGQLEKPLLAPPSIKSEATESYWFKVRR